MSVEIAWKQNILVTDSYLLKLLLVVLGFGLQAFVCDFSRQNICSVFCRHKTLQRIQTSLKTLSLSHETMQFIDCPTVSMRLSKQSEVQNAHQEMFFSHSSVIKVVNEIQCTIGSLDFLYKIEKINISIPFFCNRFHHHNQFHGKFHIVESPEFV